VGYSYGGIEGPPSTEPTTTPQPQHNHNTTTTQQLNCCVAVVLRLCCGCVVVVSWLCCGCGVLHNTTIKHRYKIKINHAMAPVPAITRNRKRTARCCSARVGTTVFQMNSIMFTPSVCHSLKYEFVSVCSKLYAFPHARLAVLKTYSQRC